jgi:hypothetical protein
MRLDDDRMYLSLNYLARSDKECADLLAAMRLAEEKAEAVKAQLFLHSDGSVAERNAKAVVDERYQAAVAESIEAEQAYKRVEYKRKTETIVFEAWRSLNSNRRMGSV